MLYDPMYLLLIIVATVLGASAQAYVNSTYRKYNAMGSADGRSGVEVARRMLDEAGLHEVGIEPIAGSLTDHYDPRMKVLRLSHGVYEGRTVAAAGIAAHEAGHAVQHARTFAFAALRQALVPAANLGSSLAFPLILIGIFMRFPSLVDIGVLLFAAAVLFSLVTLPVEFDASRRALVALGGGGMMPVDHVSGARRVLTAAALTYVVATLVAVMQLIYFLGLSRRS